MRPTVETTDRQRARPLALAASPGQKGFSGLVQEAIDLFLDQIEKAGRPTFVARSLGAMGTFEESEAKVLRQEVERIRESWRRS